MKTKVFSTGKKISADWRGCPQKSLLAIHLTRD
jgi:hypothetical protein